jgi:hypothetical protein
MVVALVLVLGFEFSLRRLVSFGGKDDVGIGDAQENIVKQERKGAMLLTLLSNNYWGEQ